MTSLKDLNTKVFNCIVCAEEIKPFFAIDDGSIIGEELPISDICFGGGTVIEHHIGYGSDFDGDTVLITLCDRCIDLKYAFRLLKNVAESLKKC